MKRLGTANTKSAAIKQRRAEPEIVNSLQTGLEEALRSQTSPESLLALALQIKLKKEGVRVSVSEQRRLRQAAAEFLRSGDATVLGKAVPRKRSVRIRLTDRDLQKLGRIVTEVTEATVEGMARPMMSRVEPDVSNWLDSELEWLTAVRTEFEQRLARTWRMPFRRFARFRRLAEFVGQLVVAHFHEGQVLESSRLANALVLLHARACLVAGEIETLMRAGYADGAAVRWRTLHEIAVIGSFLVEHGEGVAERYLAHFPCEQLKGTRSYDEHSRALGYRRLGGALFANWKVR